ncbi:hypothetical protein G5714_024202 [Onychostoma macrolepis]|uniref:Retrotransposon gag domain-containing protein n=1 Tax=Onychostoma macrolepis TaxID=369639 RepID=A0A7J6BJR5_9TELE|nr:hypothetical protein G5714_024202 [Onychostoma macrolepis]
MKDNMEHLPHPSDSGKRFAEAFELFCREFSPTGDEIKRLLVMKMGTTHWSKLSSQLARLEVWRVEADWDNASNQVYKEAVEQVCDAIKRAFLLHVDTSKIQQCHQAPEETMEDYYERLHETFNRYSGLTEPATRGDEASTWDSHITNSFLNGLRPELCAAERMMEGQTKKKEKVLYRDDRQEDKNGHSYVKLDGDIVKRSCDKAAFKYYSVCIASP